MRSCSERASAHAHLALCERGCGEDGLHSRTFYSAAADDDDSHQGKLKSSLSFPPSLFRHGQPATISLVCPHAARQFRLLWGIMITSSGQMRDRRRPGARGRSGGRKRAREGRRDMHAGEPWTKKNRKGVKKSGFEAVFLWACIDLCCDSESQVNREETALLRRKEMLLVYDFSAAASR